jgi:hypothetical protein
MVIAFTRSLAESRGLGAIGANDDAALEALAALHG